MTVSNKSELHIVIKFVWFVLFGGWLATLAALLAWALALTFIGLPVAFWLANRLTKIATLQGVEF